MVQFAKKQALKNKHNVAPDKQEKIDQLIKSFEREVERLQSSSLGKKKGSKKGHCMLFLGMLYWGHLESEKLLLLLTPGCTFLARKGALEALEVQNIAPGFFSTDAILLDTAGRYVADDNDQEEWQAFLSMIRKKRKKRTLEWGINRICYYRYFK